MRPTPNRPPVRAGFTLVELLVVMTIIAILVALTSAAVSRAIVKADEVRTRNDISQLEAAVQQFKTEFAVSYLPSKITLPPAQPQPPIAGYDNTGESLQYISSLWPRINPTMLGNSSLAFQLWGINGNQPVTLSGDQCLVFFLGGFRDQANNTFGFSTNPTNPMVQVTLSGESRKGPFFNFPPGRLKVFTHLDINNNSNPNDQFPSFLDTYGTLPYLYFSTRKTANDYPTYTTNTGYGVYPNKLLIQGGASYQVFPYQVSGQSHLTQTAAIRVWANKSSCQIISGGRDTNFGEGGINWPGYTGGGSPGATSLDGYDDMANFHPTLIGVGAP
jgi:prepilin-type N-terminal cleavage/methylation domain-containing protein